MKQPKKLNWEKEFDKNWINPWNRNNFGIPKAHLDIKDFIKRLLTTQRQQILEEIKTRVDTWGGFEDDGGNLCHYDSEILEWVNDLLNKKL